MMEKIIIFFIIISFSINISSQKVCAVFHLTFRVHRMLATVLPGNEFHNGCNIFYREKCCYVWPIWAEAARLISRRARCTLLCEVRFSFSKGKSNSNNYFKKSFPDEFMNQIYFLFNKNFSKKFKKKD